jgi:hypothetical protein
LEVLGAVGRGSNAANFATGNASLDVGFNRGPATANYGPRGLHENYGIEGPDMGWARTMGYLGPGAMIDKAATIAALNRGDARGSLMGMGNFGATGVDSRPAVNWEGANKGIPYLVAPPSLTPDAQPSVPSVVGPGPAVTDLGPGATAPSVSPGPASMAPGPSEASPIGAPSAPAYAPSEAPQVSPGLLPSLSSPPAVDLQAVPNAPVAPTEAPASKSAQVAETVSKALEAQGVPAPVAREAAQAAKEAIEAAKGGVPTAAQVSRALEAHNISDPAVTQAVTEAIQSAVESPGKMAPTEGPGSAVTQSPSNATPTAPSNPAQANPHVAAPSKEVQEQGRQAMQQVSRPAPQVNWNPQTMGVNPGVLAPPVGLPGVPSVPIAPSSSPAVGPTNAPAVQGAPANVPAQAPTEAPAQQGPNVTVSPGKFAGYPEMVGAPPPARQADFDKNMRTILQMLPETMRGKAEEEFGKLSPQEKSALVNGKTTIADFLSSRLGSFAANIAISIIDNSVKGGLPAIQQALTTKSGPAFGAMGIGSDRSDIAWNAPAIDLTGDPGGLQDASPSLGDQGPGLSGFDNTTFAPSTYSGPADLSGNPGGLQDAMPGPPTDVAPAPSAPFESVPMVQGPMDLPGISIAGLGMPEASDAMGGELPMLIAEVAQSVGMQPQQLAEIMITAQELARSLGIPVEMALQVIMQSAAQPQGGRYA